MPQQSLRKSRGSYSRGGCQNCRKRHVKCDQARPGCITCRANGVECDGYQQPRLQWVNGSEEVSTGSDNPITRFPNFPYSSEEAQVSSSAELVSSLSHTSLDGSLADVDYMSKQCPETRDGVFVGPFGAFSAQAQTPTPSIHGSPGSPIQDDIVMSHPVPELDEPDTTHQHRSQELEPSPDLDCWPNSDNFLDWQDVFDLDSSTILPASLDLDSIQALPTPLDGTPSFQNAPEDVWLAENQQTYQDPSQPPALSGLLSPTEAQLLLGHYSSNVIAHIWSFPLGRKSSMDIHFDTAVSTLARLTLVARTPVSHASLSHLYAVLAISSKHMGDNVQRETREYWSDLAERLYSVSWDNFRHSLKHETSPKVAKYKDLVMAISSLNSFSILYDRPADARTHLLECERLLKTLGLSKTSISRKATYLHHTYTWARIVGESTYVSSRRGSPDPGHTNRHQHDESLQESLPCHSFVEVTGLPKPVSKLRFDDFMGLKPNTTKADAICPADQTESPLQDMHLQDIRGKSDPSLRFLYGVSEAWLSLVSQTTRLANQIEKPNAAANLDNAPASISLARRKRHLENHMWSHVADSLSYAEARSGPNPQEDSSSSHRAHLIRALDCSLIIFFYRRVLNSHAQLLQRYVGYVIDALRDFNLACEKQYVDSPGSPWPAFIAGCEASDSSHRAYFVDWLEKSFEKTGFTRYKTAISCMRETWSRYDNARGVGDIDCTWMQVCKDQDLYVILC